MLILVFYFVETVGCLRGFEKPEGCPLVSKISKNSELKVFKNQVPNQQHCFWTIELVYHLMLTQLIEAASVIYKSMFFLQVLLKY